MKPVARFACTAGAIGALVAVLAACEPYPYAYGPDYYYGPPNYSYYEGAPGPGYDSAYYEDPCDADPNYCGYGYYEGPLWFGGSWYSGPHRWRDYGGGRQFYVHGAWHGEARAGRGGQWHGPGKYEHRRP